jgi:hypothetical protein
MIVMTGLLGFLFFFVLIYFCCLVTSYCHSSFPRNPKNLSTWLNQRIADYHLLMEYLNYYKLESVNRQEKEEEDSKMNASIISFGYLLSNVMKMICLITLVSLFFSLPVYLLKEISASADDEDDTGNPYITHSHMYRWLWTMAFLTGSLPAILVLILTFVSIISFAFLLNRLDDSNTRNSASKFNDNLSYNLSSSSSSSSLSGFSSWKISYASCEENSFENKDHSMDDLYSQCCYHRNCEWSLSLVHSSKSFC